jgi:Rod binding domain-containing protein
MNGSFDLSLSGLDMETVQRRFRDPGQKMPGIKDHDEKSEIKKVAKEMEALFVNELIKVMRKTSESISPDSKGLGNDTYMDLFDMEVSRAMADRGFGLQDAIEKWLEKRTHVSDTLNSGTDKK